MTEAQLKLRNTLLLLLVAFGCSQKGEKPNYVSKDGAWCWFSDPRAVYFEGEHKRTYSAWVSSEGSIVAGYYDHEADSSVEKLIAWKFEIDDHNNPAVHIDSDGYIQLFYTKHSREFPILTTRSRSAESISRWTTPDTLSLNETARYAEFRNSYTYTNISQLESDSNRMFMIWRGMDFKPNISYSLDNAKTWSKGEILVLPERIYNQRRPYLKFYDNNQDRIHFAFTDGHPRKEPTNSIYYMRYEDGNFKKAGGGIITPMDSLPVDPASTDKVYDATSTGKKAWIWDVAENDQGNPVLAYASFSNDSTHFYNYSIWDGSKWLNSEIVAAGRWFPQTPTGKVEPEPNYSGGVSIDHENPEIVYLSRQVDGVFEIEKWETPDMGQSWESTAITSDSKKDNVRPFAIWGADESVEKQVIWMEVDRYIHYTDFKTALRIR